MPTFVWYKYTIHLKIPAFCPVLFRVFVAFWPSWLGVVCYTFYVQHEHQIDDLCSTRMRQFCVLVGIDCRMVPSSTNSTEVHPWLSAKNADIIMDSERSHVPSLDVKVLITARTLDVTEIFQKAKKMQLFPFLNVTTIHSVQRLFALLPDRRYNASYLLWDALEVFPSFLVTFVPLSTPHSSTDSSTVNTIQ